ncbi:MAG: hypothetical protein ACRERC_23460 [Candidatus Binatia bacterium]
MWLHGALIAVLGVVLASALTGCGDDCSTDCFATPSPTPTVTPIATPIATPEVPTSEPFSCVVADCGPDATCASLGFVDPVRHCYLFNGQYLCCRQSPFE